MARLNDKKNHYPYAVHSDVFKQMVCEDYLRGNTSKEEIRRKYGIKGSSALLYWLRQLGHAGPQATTKSEPLIMAGPKDVHRDLEKENEDLKLQLEMYKRMISLAEKEFKISIVKKSGTK